MAEQPDRYGVIGCPVAHSRSPEIHATFARQTGQRLAYERLEVPPQRFRAAVAEFRAGGGRGLNVTLPHKQAAARLADRLSERAQVAAAVNTLVFRDDEVYGDNTDGAGLVRDLTTNLEVGIAGARILVLGAGGAARGILPPLLAARPAVLVIANRTVPRARELARRFRSLGEVHACGYAEIPAGEYRLVINATSAGLAGESPAWPRQAISGATFCYDLSYAPSPTGFCTWAESAGALGCASGWGMLVEQAAESFALWRGIRPDTGPLLRRG